MKSTGYTLEEVAKHNKRNDCWIILYENVYDITEFMKHHSGKFFPLQVAGKNGTGLFESIHPKRAKTILNSNDFKKKYYKGYIIRNKRDIINNFQYDSNFGEKLNERVENYFESVKNTPKGRGGRNEKIIVYSKFIIITIFTLWTKYKQLQLKSIKYSALYGICMLLIIFNVSHGANHGELIKRYPRWFSLFSEKLHFLLGTSDKDWRKWHNVSHHQHTNTSQDLDANRSEPFFRMYKNDNYLRHYKFQYIYVFIIYPLTHLLVFCARTKYTYLLYSFINILGAFRFTKKVNIIKCLLVESFVFGFLFVMINHITHLNDRVIYDHINNGCWYENQIRSTANWSCDNMFITHLLGGVNYQIEHHLFQSVHHYHYPAIKKIVQQTCKENNIPYHEFPNYRSAIYSHYKFIKQNSTP